MHGGTSGRHWVHYKPPILGTLGVGMYVGGFRWFWMGSLHKNIQLMLGFLKGHVMHTHTHPNLWEGGKIF